MCSKYIIKEKKKNPVFQFYIKSHSDQGLQVPCPTADTGNTFIMRKGGEEHWVTVNTKPGSAKKTKPRNPKDTSKTAGSQTRGVTAARGHRRQSGGQGKASQTTHS